MAENDSHRGDSVHPASRIVTEGARARRAAARREGRHRMTSDSDTVGTIRPEAERSHRKTEIASSLDNETQQKALTDRLNRTSESDKKAHLKRELEQMEHRNRELKLSTDRRVMSQRTNDGAGSPRNGTEQKALTDRLNRTSESDKKAHIKRELEQMGRRNHELNLPNDRRVMSQRTNDGAGSPRNGTEQKALTDRLNRTSESDKKAHLKRELEQMGRRNRELNLPNDRRVMIQSDDVERNSEHRREQLAKSRLMPYEMTGWSETEFRNRQPDAMVEKAYAAYRDGALKGKLEKGEGKNIKVHGKDLIIPRDAPRKPESPEFWDHHGNTKKTYDKFARQYPEIQRRLAEGTKIEDIRKDPEYKDAAGFWYSAQNIVTSEYKNYQFVETGYHRAELAREYNLEGVTITAYEWKDLENK